MKGIYIGNNNRNIIIIGLFGIFTTSLTLFDIPIFIHIVIGFFATGISLLILPLHKSPDNLRKLEEIEHPVLGKVVQSTFTKNLSADSIIETQKA